MSRLRRRAVDWAWDTISAHGTPDIGGLVHVALSQAELAARAGWARGDGRISRYLADLGDVVVSRTDGLRFDVGRLAALERARMVSPRSAQVAEQLQASFGHLDADGTVVLATTSPDGPRPPRLAEMAEVVGVAPSTLHRHLRALERAGRLRRLDPAAATRQAVSDGPAGRELVRYLLDRTETLAGELADAHRLARALLAERGDRSPAPPAGVGASGARSGPGVGG